ncbi:MAG: penicillin-binding transpeptidase domain-containing protein, partial [Rhodobacteraceae bacterium]|nr:penicillin-binding transpeptidase domain-containing protein [Paracoccaceae bacterium]
SEAQFERDCRRTTLWRKFREIPFSFALEIKYGKEEILTIYLNRAYLGAGATGFEAASQRYFGVSIREVSPAESAMLAGLLAAPSIYAPTRNMANAVARANLIIGLMENQGYLSVSEAEEARARHAQLSTGTAARAGSYFADWIMETVPDFLSTDTKEDMIMRTTLDLQIQKSVDDALEHVFATKVKAGSRAEAAIVVMSADGAVRAMTGGRNPRATGQFNRATQALRQTGSAFKPFVFATALESGINPSDTFLDAPVSFQVPGSGTWRPKNYKNEYDGLITLTEALAKSSNVIAAGLSETVGRERVHQTARNFGIDSALAKGPAIALGASESTLVEMTAAYATIMNGGNRTVPFGLVDLRLKGDSKPLFTRLARSSERAVSRRTALLLTDMLRHVVEDGTGQRASLGARQAAGKTGTTQGARDAWFIGFTADYVTGVWMGYDDNTPLTGVTGGGLPAEIWKEAMLRIHDGVELRPLPSAATIRQ